jgi:hypothetical protein
MYSTPVARSDVVPIPGATATPTIGAATKKVSMIGNVKSLVHVTGWATPRGLGPVAPNEQPLAHNTSSHRIATR